MRLTEPAEALLTRSTHSWSEEFNTIVGDDKFWAAQVRYPAWDFLKVSSVLCRSSACQPSRGTRMPTTVAFRSVLVPGTSCVSHSRQHSPSEDQGRYPPHRLQWVQNLKGVFVFARQVQRPVLPSGVAHLHPLSAAPQHGDLPCDAEAQSRLCYKRRNQVEAEWVQRLVHRV